MILAAIAAHLTGGDQFSPLREQMVRQIEGRGIRDPEILRVMRATPRHLFLPTDLQSAAYQDRPLPIGRDATISQPYIVALMTELLEPAKAGRVPKSAPVPAIRRLCWRN
jgi:protein-L-isoaspartate(D-aspartate) O-methyltransferase